MTTPTTTREADAYLAAVRNELTDLPEEDRAELLEDLAAHLADLVRDEHAPDQPLVAVLGAPATYAADLRAAAGLPPRRTRAVIAIDPVRRLLAIARHPKVASARAFARELAPAWWMARGYLWVAVPVWMSPNRSDDFPVPTILGSALLGLGVVVIAIAASVLLGRRSLTARQRRAVALADVALAVVALSLLAQAEARLAPTYYVTSHGVSPSALTSPFGPVTNIFPYSADGRPLDGVLLFDQDGRPLRVTDQQWWADGCARIREPRRATDGGIVDFAYPQRYVLHRHDEPHCAPDLPRPAVPLPSLGAGSSSPPPTAAPPAEAPAP